MARENTIRTNQEAMNSQSAELSLNELQELINEEIKLRKEAEEAVDDYKIALLKQQVDAYKSAYKDVYDDLVKQENKLASLKKKNAAAVAAYDKRIQEAEQDGDKELQKRLKREKKWLKQKAKLEEAQEKANDSFYEKRYQERAKLQAKIDEQAKKDQEEIFGKGKTLTERAHGIASAFSQGAYNGFDTLIDGIANLSKKLDNQVEEIAGYKSAIDTRLYGLNGQTAHWDSMSKTITGAIGVSPYVKQADVTKNLATLVESGIAYNVEQRAFLQTISDEIATTFNAANNTLLEIVRIQQSDSTAARLGMEASMTEYLNSMFSDTEYLTNEYETVLSKIYSASSLMSSDESIGFEYQVQKWLGSLYSVGMSSSAIQSIATALGQLGSGDVSGLTGSSIGSLLAMSATKAGLSYSEMLTEGLDDSKVNTLMESMVEYLASIASSNKVVQSQYAAVFGLTASDIKAAGNLSESLGTISSYSLDTSGALSTLTDMMSTIGDRMSLGEMMSNVWENVQYSMSAGIASNPALYGIWKAASLLEDVAGGIALPDIKVMGSGVNLQTTVADLMRVGALSGGILSSIGAMMGAGSSGGFDAAGMLSAFGINTSSIDSQTRGAGGAVRKSAKSVSQSSYIGNSDSSDIYESTVTSANDEGQAQLIEAKEEDNSVTLDIVNEHVVDIYNILNSVYTGTALRVQTEKFGLSD